MSPSSGAVGTLITLSGDNFWPGLSTVTFNGVVATPISMTDSSILVPVPAGATTGPVLVTNVAGDLGNSLTFTVTEAALPSGWSDGDVGSVGGTGGANYLNGTFTVAGSGQWIWDVADGMHFVYQALSGDGTIVARVVSAQGGPNLQAGVMIRETLGAGSVNAYVAYRPIPRIDMTERASTGASTTYQTISSGVTLPYWVKLVRSGNTLSGYASSDGVNWVQVGASQTIAMAQTVYIGLAVSSDDNTSLATVNFDSISLSSTAAPAPVITSITPTTGSTGAQVVMTGSGFGGSQGSSVVTLNGIPETINSWSDTSITITIPTGVTPGFWPLVVSVGPSMNDSNPVTFFVPSATLPVPWLDQDVGSVGVAGSASYYGTFTVMGSGQWIWAVAAGMHFVYQPLSGDGTIVARVVSAQGGPNLQAGVVIRETLGAGSANAYLAYRPIPRIDMTERASTGAGTAYQSVSSGVTLPYWVKLVRSGNTFSGYASSDGVNWVQVGASQTIAMAQTVYIGLAVSSDDNTSLATVNFDNISVSSVAAPAPVINSITPTMGPAGTQVVITGTGFGALDDYSYVTVNGVSANTINSWSDTSITIIVPTGVTSGFWPLVVTVGPSANNSNPAIFFVPSTTLPTPWLDQDVGSVGVAGSANYLNGTFTVAGSGQWIWDVADAMHFVYQALSGDGTIVARVVSAQGGPSLQAGVMIRETLDAGSANAYVAYRPIPRIDMTERASTGGGSTYQSISSGVTLPYWVKLVRSGNTLSGYTSSDGVNWVQVGTSQTIAMAQTVYIGLAVSSDDNTSLATVNFDSISLSSTAAPAPVITSTSPTMGSIGTQVVITGSGFGASQGSSVVTLNGIPETINSWGDTSITITIPTGVAPGFWPLVVSVGPSMNNSNPVTFFVPSATLPTSWLDQDVGSVGVAGSASFVNGAFTVMGSGQWIWDVADGMHFVYQSLAGDGTIVARVVSAQGGPNLQAGVMIRETLGAGSTNAYVAYRPIPRIDMTERASTGASTTYQNISSGVTLPYWVKLVRSGNTLSGYASSDGVNWVQVGASQTIAMAQTVYIGLAVSSDDNTSLATVNFDSISLSSTAAPAAVIVSIAVSPSQSTLAVGASQQFTAIGTFSDGSTHDVTATAAWSSSLSAVATVTGGGLATAISQGTTVIQASLSTLSSSTALTVQTPALLSINVTPANPFIRPGFTQQFLATGNYSNDSTQDLSATAVWSSSAPGVATIANAGIALGVGQGQTTIQATVGAISGSTILTVSSAGFALTGSLSTSRYGHTATLLNNGKVLVAGGSNASGVVATAELYDLTGGTFAGTGNMINDYSSPTATLLKIGMVLITGGYSNGFALQRNAEMYNWATGNFLFTGMPNVARFYHTATLLKNGKVLIVGGCDYSCKALSSVEIYDPTAGTFTIVGNLNVARYSHTATLLNNGMVLIAGGCNDDGYLASAELYDPTAGTFTLIASLNFARYLHTATLLNNGMVLIAGGFNNGLLSSAELYDPTRGTFSLTGNLNTPRYSHTATLLTDGDVLIAGGSGQGSLANAELFDPTTGTFTPTGSMNSARYGHTATLLSNGMVLIAGGYGGGGVLSSAELYRPSTLTPNGLVSIALNPLSPSLPMGASQTFDAMGTFADGSTQTLASATWTSSDTTVATVTNDASNYGTAIPVAVGSATISACTGSLCGSTTITVIPPVLVSLAITPVSPTLYAGSSLQFQATGTFTDGSTQDLTSSVTWNSVSPMVATINAMGLASAFTAGTTAIQASQGSVNSSTTLNVLPPPLISLAVLPTVAGTVVGGTQQFTATGTYADGSTQNLTTLVAWSSSSAGVATIGASGLATGAGNGNTTITATMAGITNSVSLTVTATTAPPTITASALPPPNANGWNTSNVTVTFTCTAGSSNVLNCPSAQTVTSEGANQVIAGTVTDAAGNTATASVTINLDKTGPAIAITSPDDGTILNASLVPVSGTVSDNLSGVSSLSCNSSAGAVSGSSFTCAISANTGVNMVLVKATDVAGNASAAIIHVTLPISVSPLPTPNSLQISPSSVTMLIGDSQSFTAVDDRGRPRPDATWTVSDTTIATLPSDGSGTLTAVAAGQVTLTATVQAVSAQTQVTVLAGGMLSTGTVRWSAPAVPGFTASMIIQAVPTTGGPDFFSLENDSTGNVLVRAFQSNGTQMWQNQVSASFPGAILNSDWGVGDSFGGLLLRGYITDASDFLVDLDGQTGNQKWVYSLASDREFTWGNGLNSDLAIGLDGTVFITEDLEDYPEYAAYLDSIDGNAGTLKGQVQLPNTTWITTNADCTGIVLTLTFPDAWGSPTVAPDGSVYLETRSGQSNTVMGCPPPENGPVAVYSTSSTTISLLRVTPDGAPQYQTLDTVGAYLGKVVPDGQGGVLADWNPWNLEKTMMKSTSSGATYPLPWQYYYRFTDDHTVVGENGNVFITNGSVVAAMDPSSGSVEWTYQPPQGSVNSILATAGGGVMVIDGQMNQIPLDASGNAGTIVTGIGSNSPLALGNWISTGGTGLTSAARFRPMDGSPSDGSISGLVSLVVGSLLEMAASPYPAPDGNLQLAHSPPKPVISHFIPVTTSDLGISPEDAMGQISKALPGRVATHLPRIGSAATVNNFIDDLAKPIAAVGFIGHSFDISTQPPNPTTFSVGLWFYGNSSLIRTPDPNNPQLNYTPYSISPPPVEITQIHTQAKVVFIGSCYIGPIFKAIWNIQDGTTGQAMIVLQNPSQPVILGHALTAWTNILNYMVNGVNGHTMNVGEAVNQVNTDLRNLKVDVNNNPITEQYMVVGDSNVKISP